MLYRVTIEGREREVDVNVTPGGAVRVSLDGEPVDADVVRVPGGLSLRLGDRMFDIAIGGSGEAMEVTAGAARAVASVTSERMRAKSKKSGGLSLSGNELRAPMPGRIVKILVVVGQELALHAPCVVIEAMKMENELLAPAAARVVDIHVEEGASVEGRALLLTLEPAPATAP